MLIQCKKNVDLTLSILINYIEFLHYQAGRVMNNPKNINSNKNASSHSDYIDTDSKWRVREKTFIKNRQLQQQQQVANNVNYLNNYSHILENIKHINKKIVENNEELVNIENFTKSTYFSTSSSSSSFQASTSTESTSSFSSLSELSTALNSNAIISAGQQIATTTTTTTFVKKETRSVALCYYHHLYNEKQKANKSVNFKKNTQPLYKLTYKNVACHKATSRVSNELNSVEKSLLQLNKYKNVDAQETSTAEKNLNMTNINKIFRLETNKKLQFKSASNLNRHVFYDFDVSFF